ncbi:hypothetical protein DDB_G0275131 [Dictyostelium discoideum AX4]|uniref:Uncharacterized protein n=1 Tax=Dictyostelium discoideum TaxID=44689 RepID=Q8T2R1_DICDI|nr:hypothetical protein DDB_G0275131 [Dictyostelium discoideum AX4]EAL69846.1 hypothetical protein DDB_G0275131 [Dictyostelium discoideum AX4]|eukprot:XP_643714.1 hypothetical protein DDB_G0275131 [Dictyostelium discoideum AX4]
MLFKSISQIINSKPLNLVNKINTNTNENGLNFKQNEISSTDLYAKSLFFVKPCYCF